MTIFLLSAALYLLLGAALVNWGIEGLDYDEETDRVPYVLTFSLMTLVWPLLLVFAFYESVKQAIQRNR